ncbi:rhodanese-like domain-containing protein [Oculatella sp. LEGE 06141]|uniref:rhodanese-like domain-containing protein n=1 Tax=Oculatella sp. LEGE 06141 TaxID=1828648 RepID=UPI0018813B51|nr:rhodanese-like domain-containing protein [Oculatella sp. LEGE 06141]MBE9181355.1 rhodanese-like domain-containing protein [Oculatella sp. LEGE 06141]
MGRFFGIIPTPPPLQAKSRVNDLKARLDWGEPALTIIDTRDRTQFNASHIMGALSMPLDELVDRATRSLACHRDLYVYGETDEETAVAAAKLRQAGYSNVAELRGGVAAWKAMGYPVESISKNRAA